LQANLAEWTSTFPTSLTAFKCNLLRNWCPLPSSLLYLDAGNDFQATQNIVVPASLISFKTSCIDKSTLEILLPLLPQSLETLDFAVLPSLIPSSGFTHLAPSLRTLNVMGLNALEFDTLPPLLTVLSLWKPQTSQFGKIPATVTDLTITWGEIHAEPSDLVPLLPCQLLHLRCLYMGNFIPVTPILQALSWPHGLLTLDWDGAEFSEAALNSLPPTITNLVIKQIDNACKKVPRWKNLRHVRVQVLPRSPTVFLELFVLNSLMLTKLKCTPDYFNTVALLDLSNDSEVESQVTMTAWPKFEEISPNRPVRFGNCLQSLSLDVTIDYVDDIFLSLVPESLVTLKLWNAPNITDDGLLHLQKCYNLLTLQIPASNLVTGRSFVFLPRSMRHLGAEQISEVVDHDLAGLPRTLTTLELNAAYKLTDLCATFLPPALRSLSAQACPNFTSDFVKNAPTEAFDGENPLTVRAANFASIGKSVSKSFRR
jgi:hypothetical protein